METEADIDGQAADTAPAIMDPEATRKQDEARAALVKRIRREIEADKKHHAPAFKRMRRDMQVATWGKDTDWAEGNYVANIIGRHIKQKTASLYAKNPKIVARRRETLDFALWDENPQSAMQAYQLVQQAAQMQAMAPPQMDPMTGQAMPPAPPPIPGLMEANQLIEDIVAGLQQREQIKRISKTLETLTAYFLKEQSPLDFKSAMKQLVRRACTTGVGYVELGFQRENGPRPDVQNQLADARARLDHLAQLAKDASEGEIGEVDAEIGELTLSVQSLQNEPEIVLREGLVFDYPQSTRVIPDRLTKKLTGFIGARHITVELLFTKAQVRDLFDVDMKEKGKVYKLNGDEEEDASPMRNGDGEERYDNDLVCVQKFYEKTSGLCYILCEGYDQFLREPAAPDVFVEEFWPVYALTFNDVENEKELFPPSDVALLLDAQKEYNRSRQGMREHRDAAKPRWGFAQGALDEDDQGKLKASAAFDAIPLNIPPGTKLSDILQEIPVPGVDPNLYEVGQLFSDMQYIAGAQQAQLGGMSKGTATEAAVAAQAAGTADGAAVDDLDAFMTRIARGMGQVLMREMSPEQVMEIVGPGAVWPEETLEQIVNELALEVEAGSTGKPNQAQEIQNWEKMLPYLLQMGSLDPTWLARETLRRLDDRMDLTEAIAVGLPSIMAMNRNAGQPQQDPNADPNAQGEKGGDNTPKPDNGPSGSSAPMGDNGSDVMGPGDTGAAPVM
jgi:hypothetical protein